VICQILAGVSLILLYKDCCYCDVLFQFLIFVCLTMLCTKCYYVDVLCIELCYNGISIYNFAMQK
jgi:hypothetical protein